jgi:hypothetical protein
MVVLVFERAIIVGGEGVLFSLLSLFFFPWCFLLWVFSALLVLSDASSFFCFVGALSVAWVLFYVGLFSVRTPPFFFFCEVVAATTRVLSGRGRDLDQTSVSTRRWAQPGDSHI